MSQQSPHEDGRRATFCRICESFCGLEAEVSGGRIRALLPDGANPHSQGQLCPKGTSFLDVLYDPDRVLTPLRRTGGPGEFTPVSWDEALADIADRLASVLRRDGADAIAAYLGNPNWFGVSAAMSSQPFLAHFGVWKTFSSVTQDAAARLLASHILYGSAFRMPIPDLPRCDFLLAIGANMLVSHGSVLTAPLLREDLDAIAARGRVVVVDPRRTETAGRYEHIFVRPDTDAWLLGAMLNVIFQEGLAQLQGLAQSTVGWEQLRDAVQFLTPDIASDHCGIPAAQIADLARTFAHTPRAVAYGRTGTCRGRFSTLINVFICALNIVAGKFAVPGGWVFGDSPLEGAMPFPSGFEFRETRLGAKPYVGNNLPFGFLIDDILTDGPGRTRALIVASGNMVLTAPGGRELEQALDSLDVFVSLDLYVTETNRFADYILPCTTFLEREDIPLTGLAHMIRPFIQYSDKVIAAVGEARDEHDVWNELAAKLHAHLCAEIGNSRYCHASAPHFEPMAVMDALLRGGGVKVRDPAGVEQPLSIELLKRYPHGLTLADNLTCSNSWSKISHEDGRAHLWNALLDPELERMRATPVAGPGELRLFGRRAPLSINSWMHNSSRLVKSQFPSLMMNSADADARGILDGQRVEVCSISGSMQVSVTVSDEIIAGAVCYPHGWGHRGGWQRANATQGANVNELASKTPGDMLSGSTLLDGIAVTVRRIAEESARTG
jgi:anaerobic selenocysteine-containing dehydrogenase